MAQRVSDGTLRRRVELEHPQATAAGERVETIGAHGRRAQGAPLLLPSIAAALHRRNVPAARARPLQAVPAAAHAQTGSDGDAAVRRATDATDTRDAPSRVPVRRRTLLATAARRQPTRPVSRPRRIRLRRRRPQQLGRLAEGIRRAAGRARDRLPRRARAAVPGAALRRLHRPRDDAVVRDYRRQREGDRDQVARQKCRHRGASSRR